MEVLAEKYKLTRLGFKVKVDSTKSNYQLLQCKSLAVLLADNEKRIVDWPDDVNRFAPYVLRILNTRKNQSSLSLSPKINRRGHSFKVLLG